MDTSRVPTPSSGESVSSRSGIQPGAGTPDCIPAIPYRTVTGAGMTTIVTTKQMEEWRRMEAEHSKSRATQEKIVMQHIHEHGIGYYPALKKMENKLEKKK